MEGLTRSIYNTMADFFKSRGIDYENNKLKFGPLVDPHDGTIFVNAMFKRNGHWYVERYHMSFTPYVDANGYVDFETYISEIFM